MKKLIIVFSAVSSFLFIVFIVATRTTAPSKFKNYEIKGNVGISVPEYLYETNDIDTAALLQFKNEKKQVFLLVYEINHSAQIDVKEKFHQEVNNLVNKMDKGNLLNFYPANINGIHALIGTIRGSTRETKVSYNLILFNKNSVWYKIIAGTTESNKNNLKEDIDKIIKSINSQ